ADAGIARTALGAAGNAAIGAAGAAGGQAAEAMLPEGSPWRPLADFGGQMAGGGLMAGGMAAGKAGLNLGAGYARDFLGPLNPSMRQGIVADKLRSASSDPGALARGVDVEHPGRLPGSLPTSYRLSGDQGIGRLQGA